PPGKSLDINSLRQFTTGDVRQDFFDKANGHPFRGKTVEDWVRIRPAALRLIAASKPGHHFVKTHCQVIKVGPIDLILPEVTAAAVYMIRNPFDVALSYARHLAVDIDTAIDRMTDVQAVQGSDTRILEIIGRWDDHIRSWTNAPGLPRHVMRYEDMLADTGKSFRALFTFLKLPVDADKLSAALARTSFAALQKQERQKGFRERPPDMKQFFARGTAGGWREELTAQQVARIRAEFLPTLEKWYPEILAETLEFSATAAPGKVGKSA
ncbi:MAG: aryl sulfotransferase, partial [Hyphomicrobiales bacterium]